MITRRDFLDTMAVGAAGLAVATTAKSYAQIIGANDRLNFAIIGLNGRGYAHLSALSANSKSAHVGYICDVETNIMAKFAAEAQKELGYAPQTEGDFRKLLERKDIDAITIATPDHWHAPMAIARPAGRQACLRGEALQPQSRRRRAAGRSAEEIRQARADGHAAALLAAHHRDRRQDSRWR